MPVVRARIPCDRGHTSLLGEEVLDQVRFFRLATHAFLKSDCRLQVAEIRVIVRTGVAEIVAREEMRIARIEFQPLEWRPAHDEIDFVPDEIARADASHSRRVQVCAAC